MGIKLGIKWYRYRSEVSRYMVCEQEGQRSRNNNKNNVATRDWNSQINHNSHLPRPSFSPNDDSYDSHSPFLRRLNQR